MVNRAKLNRDLGRTEVGSRWHTAKWTSLPVSFVSSAERRLEAESYLSSGHGLRLVIESKRGWTSFAKHATVWQPSRLKGIILPPNHGVPFLAATQLLDVRPFARKWLSIDRTPDADSRFVIPGQMLVTCSGSVGRTIIATDAHAGYLISHDLLRVSPVSPRDYGWIYAYLRSEQTRAMMTTAQYGHIIKHLECSHLNALPIPLVRDEIAEELNAIAHEILLLRNQAHERLLEAESLYEEAFSGLTLAEGELGFSVSLRTSLSSSRRRFDAAFHSPRVRSIKKHLFRKATTVHKLSECGYRAWLPNRFKRIPAESGIDLVDSSSVFETNPEFKKRIAETNFGDAKNGRIEENWLLMSRSGQVYGLLGSVALATASLENKIISDDLIRIAPTDTPSIRAGYLFICLSHPFLGRPLVKALAYGSSIPHIFDGDLDLLPIPRLEADLETRIADRAEEAAQLRERADYLEKTLGERGTQLIAAFISGENDPFVKGPIGVA